MADAPLTTPVVIDGIVSDEKLADLLGLQAEYPELDYKATIDLSTRAGTVELAKDVGAMQVRGGYIIAGVDNEGTPTGSLDEADLRPFDEANLVPRLRRWLPEPLVLRSRVAERDGHRLIVLYIGAHPSGCAFFHADGLYMSRGGKETVAFRAGDVFWRDGTRSVRVTQQGLEEIIARRLAEARADWLEEQQEIRRQERVALEAAYQTRSLIDAPLATLTIDLDRGTLSSTALEFVRRGDTIALRHLLNQALPRARDVIERDDEAAFGDLLDKLACLAAVFVEHALNEWLEQVIRVFSQIYSSPLAEGDALRFGYATHISPAEKGPRVWLRVIERIFAIGALAVRRENWHAVRELTLQRPERLTDYDANWLRHALTMASRAQHLHEERDAGRAVELSLLSLAREVAARVECLRPDGVSADDDAIITSLAQFDILSNLAAIDGAHDPDGRVFYPNFARFRQARIQPVVDRLLTDTTMRQALFTGSNGELAAALDAIGRAAHAEGMRFDGFVGWWTSPVGAFIDRHQAPSDAR